LTTPQRAARSSPSAAWRRGVPSATPDASTTTSNELFTQPSSPPCRTKGAARRKGAPPGSPEPPSPAARARSRGRLSRRAAPEAQHGARGNLPVPPSPPPPPPQHAPPAVLPALPPQRRSPAPGGTPPVPPAPPPRPPR